MTEAAIAPPPETAPAGDLELGYQVDLDAFSGPLDLLLFLVRRSEVDIADISVAAIADQFVAALALHDLPLDVAGDFILMAATLLELKSRLLAPDETAEAAPDGADDELFDPRAGLIRQLLAYRRFKEAAQALDACADLHAARRPRQTRELIPEDPEEVDGLDLGHLDAGQLHDLWSRVLARISGLGPRTVLNDDAPIEVKIALLVDGLRTTGTATLGDFFAREPGQTGRIGVLMAALECARQRLIEARQLEQYGAVQLRWRAEDVPATMPEEPVEEPRRRRRRLALVTWQPPAAAAPVDAAAASGETAEASEPVADAPEVEELVESDEQRFLRELESACAVEAVLSRVVDLEAGFTAFLSAKAAADAAGTTDPAAASTGEASERSDTPEPAPTDPVAAAT
ncbi:MAG: segregation/condensation protein A [Planctomycetes bacterium]|nr:segregation/condensation protein A [Planctomycetota bacterium]